MEKITKQNKPLVTIAIPTYNRASGYLKQSLASAVKQTYQNIEIVVSDNCSTDNTRMVVKDFNDSRIRYFRQKENIIPNDNFNFCVKQAKGVFFSLLHDDDMIDSDFVETCMDATNYNNIDVGIIRTGMRRIDSDGKLLRECPNFAGSLSTEDYFTTWFEGKIPMHLCMTLFNTNKLKHIGGFGSKHNLFQDVLAEVILAAKFGRIDIEDTKASYRMHDGQHSSSANMRAWCEDSFLLFDTALDLVKNKRELLEIKGKKFFFRHNYRIAGKMKSSVDRYRSYLIVFSSFGYLYSMQFQFNSFVFPVLYKFYSKLRCIVGAR